MGQEAHGSGPRSHRGLRSSCGPARRLPFRGCGRKPRFLATWEISLGCLPSVLMIQKLACPERVIHETERLAPTAFCGLDSSAHTVTSTCQLEAVTKSSPHASVERESQVAGSLEVTTSGGGLPPALPTFLLEVFRGQSVLLHHFGECHTSQSKDSKGDKDTGPFLGSSAVPLALSRGLHRPCTSSGPL